MSSITFFFPPSLYLCSRSKFPTIHNPVPQFCIGPIQIVIDNDLVMCTRLVGVLQLILRLRQSLVHALLRFCASASKSSFQFFQRWRRQEQEPSVQIRALDLFDTLYKSDIVSQISAPSPTLHTSISISKIQIFPFSAMSLTAFTLVP